jgi:LysM repeat protein
MQTRQKGSSGGRFGLLVAILVTAGLLTTWKYWRGGQLSPPRPAAASAQADSHARERTVASQETPAEKTPPIIVEAPRDQSPWAPPTATSGPAPGQQTDEILEPRRAAVQKPLQPSAAADTSASAPAVPEPALAAEPRSGLYQQQEGKVADAPRHEERPTENPAIERARRLYDAGKIIEARHELNTLLTGQLSRSDQAEVRQLLTKIAAETIFSSRRLPGDPLVESYVVQPGDVLARISQRYKVPAEILMQINNISDPRRLRADQTIKVLKGPFHARIYKSEFRMDVYLQDLYVRSFRVGLGADQGTPEGVWKVKERLHNPTYYPPAGSSIKRIVPPDDPDNPLGKHWIGLEGVSGDAVGRTGYGIHGTNEPESIGKAVSLGCIRLLNEDVTVLYSMLLPGESTVTILP